MHKNGKKKKKRNVIEGRRCIKCNKKIMGHPSVGSTKCVAALSTPLRNPTTFSSLSLLSKFHHRRTLILSQLSPVFFLIRIHQTPQLPLLQKIPYLLRGKTKEKLPMTRILSEPSKFSTSRPNPTKLERESPLSWQARPRI